MEEGKPLVCELLAHLGDLAGTADDLRACSTVTDDFGADGVVPFLLHRPVHTFQMRLVIREEEFLAAIQSRVRVFIGSGVEMFGVYWTVSPSRAQ